MSFQKELRLARALYQLTIYFESLRLPFTIQYLYRATYGGGRSQRRCRAR